MIIAWKMEQFQNNGVRMPLIYVCVPQAEKDILTVPYMSVWLSSDKNAKKEVSSKLNWIYNVIKYYWNTWKEKKKSEWLPCFWATIQCGSTWVQRCRSCNRQTLLQETHPNCSKREHHTCFYISDFFTFSIPSSFHHPVLPKHFLQIGIKKKKFRL